MLNGGPLQTERPPYQQSLARLRQARTINYCFSRGPPYKIRGPPLLSVNFRFIDEPVEVVQYLWEYSWFVYMVFIIYAHVIGLLDPF